MRGAAVALALGACVAPPDDVAGPDPCGAAALAWMIGAPLPDVIDHPGPVRVFGPDDALTMDHVPGRLNVELDAARLRVVRVFCG